MIIEHIPLEYAHLKIVKIDYNITDHKPHWRSPKKETNPHRDYTPPCKRFFRVWNLPNAMRQCPKLIGGRSRIASTYIFLLRYASTIRTHAHGRVPFFPLQQALQARVWPVKWLTLLIVATRRRVGLCLLARSLDLLRTSWATTTPKRPSVSLQKPKKKW